MKQEYLIGAAVGFGVAFLLLNNRNAPAPPPKKTAPTLPGPVMLPTNRDRAQPAMLGRRRRVFVGDVREIYQGGFQMPAWYAP